MADAQEPQGAEPAGPAPAIRRRRRLPVPGFLDSSAIPLAVLLAGVTLVPASCVLEELSTLRSLSGRTEGTIVESRVEEQGGSEGGTRSTVRYEYEVEGRTYRSDRVYPASRGAMEATPNLYHTGGWAAAAAFPQGARTTVYFDPTSPGTACLELGIGAAMLALTLGGASLALLAALGAIPWPVARWIVPWALGTLLYAALTFVLFEPTLAPARLPRWFANLIPVTAITAAVALIAMRRYGPWDESPYEGH